MALGTAIARLGFCYLAFIKGLGLVFPLYPAELAEWSLTAKIFIPIGMLIALSILSRKLIQKV